MEATLERKPGTKPGTKFPNRRKSEVPRTVGVVRRQPKEPEINGIRKGSLVKFNVPEQVATAAVGKPVKMDATYKVGNIIMDSKKITGWEQCTLYTLSGEMLGFVAIRQIKLAEQEKANAE